MMQPQTRVHPTEVRLPDDPAVRRATFIISTAARDSHGTVLNQNAWMLDRYNRNPIVGYQHAVWGDGGMCNDPNPDMVIGKSTARVENPGKAARLVADAEFEPRDINELADKIWRKVVFGSIRATSVGFSTSGGEYGEGDEARGEDNETFYFDAQELYEWSIVNMGSNPETVKRDAMGKARRYLTQAVAGMRALGEPVELDRVMGMTVREALQLFEGTSHAHALLSTTRAEKRQKVTEFIRQSL